MIHELIDPKKTNRSGASKNSKTYQETKTVPEEIRLEGSDSENKGSSSTIFIPPWLRNSLGLNQRNNLSHATTGSELKPSKQNQRDKEPDQNEFVGLKTNCEQNCCKKSIEHFGISQQDRTQEVIVRRTLDDAEAVEKSSEKGIPVYWDMRRKTLENEWSYADLEPLTKEDTQMAVPETVSLEIEKLDENKKVLKFTKQKSKLRKRLLGESKRSDLERDEMDLLLQMKARQALDDCMKAGIDSEMKQLEAKLLLLGAKSQALSVSKPTEQDLRILMEVKKQLGNVEDLEKVFQHIKEFTQRNTDFQLKFTKERKRDEKEEKCSPKDEKLKPEQESLPSTDDEDDIKRFSEFLSKNKDLEEKRKCLEEVRNYFERKRKTRMTKHRYLEETKVKPVAEPEGREESNKDKAKSRDLCRGKRSKFALCGEEVVEKAVDEALQKFVELYHFRMSPSVRGSMKKNILQALNTDTTNPSQEPGSAGINLLEMGDKAAEKPEINLNTTEREHKELSPHKEVRKKTARTSNSREQLPRLSSVMNIMEDEKLKRLKRDFDVFLHSIRNNIDVTCLKLQSIILEKEDKTAKNVQLVYNFTKKALESNRTLQALKEPSDAKRRKDIETQTTAMQELLKRNVKIQAGELKNSLERYVQTEGMSCVSQVTQTEGMSLREVKDLKSCDVSPGLYRMVRSKEAGKFYLYPESIEHSHRLICGDSNCSILSEKNIENSEPKNRAREVQKARLNKGKKVPGLGITHLRGTSLRKRRKASENSISCLYFRNMDQKVTGSPSKKEVELTDENFTGVAEEAEDVDLKARKKRHLGCFWFWNGEKIAAGCDLKMHVENLLQEKLTEIVNLGAQSNELMIGGSKDESSQELMNKAPGGVRIGDAMCYINNARKNIAGNNLLFSGDCNYYERKRRIENEKINREQGALSIFQNDSGKNVETSSSQLKYLSVNMSKVKSQFGTGLKKKCTRRNVVVKPTNRRMANFKKAEDFLRAVEEIKKMKAEFSNSKRGNTSESDSFLDDSSSSSGAKNEAAGPLSVVLAREIDGITNADIKKRLKRLISLVDRQVQTIGTLEPREGNSMESKVGGATDGRKHMDLIGSVMCKVSQKERETLWNDIRNFIKTKIGKDINEEGTREVCIEIEQDVPESPQGAKHSVMARGHYIKNEGDVEVEIDLTLEDLARILHQRQKKNRRRHLFCNGKSKNFLSSSSTHSDKKHQKYQGKFGVLGESPDQDKKPSKSKGN